MADLSIGEDCFDIDYYLDYCPNCEQEYAVPIAMEDDRQTLSDLLQTPMEDVHLTHHDVEINLATIVELGKNTLTDEGKQEWSDVLDAKVCRIFQGMYGLQVELDGVTPSRLSQFSRMLAGFCSEQNYNKWVAQENAMSFQSPTMKM